jgi:hypothetical protein
MVSVEAEPLSKRPRRPWMSTFLFGRLTEQREQTPPPSSTPPGALGEGAEATPATTAPTGIGYYVDAIAALVPSEILALHAIILTQTTESAEVNGQKVVIITEPGVLLWAFWALMGCSVLLYMFAHAPRPLGLGDRKWDGWDFVRILIPPVAFVNWTMLQPSTVFDVVAPGLGEAARITAAVILAAVLAGIAAVLAGKADKAKPDANKGRAIASQPIPRVR